MRLIILLLLVPVLGMGQSTLHKSEHQFIGKWCNCEGFPLEQVKASVGKKIDGCFEFKKDHTLEYVKDGKVVYTKRWKARGKRIWVSIGLTDKMRWYEHHPTRDGNRKLMFFSTYYYVILKR